MLGLKLSPRVKIGRLGAEFPEDMEGPAWKALWPELRALDGALNWIIGDWVNAGIEIYMRKMPDNPLLTKEENIEERRKAGRKYAFALEATDWEFGRLATAAWVCRKIKPSFRKEALDWTHYTVIAGLNPKEQEKWINAAIEGKWTVSQLRIAVRKSQADAISKPERAEPQGFIPAVWISQGLRGLRTLEVDDWEEDRKKALRSQLKPIVDLYESLAA